MLLSKSFRQAAWTAFGDWYHAIIYSSFGGHEMYMDDFKAGWKMYLMGEEL